MALLGTRALCYRWHHQLLASAALAGFAVRHRHDRCLVPDAHCHRRAEALHRRLLHQRLGVYDLRRHLRRRHPALLSRYHGAVRREDLHGDKAPAALHRGGEQYRGCRRGAVRFGDLIYFTGGEMDGSQIEKIPIRKQYPAIDVARLLMAFCVVAIHISPFQDISASLNFWTHDWIVRIAVPFFFTASGFFLFRKMRDGCHVSDLRRYWLRILRVYIIWSIFYLPLIYETVLQDPDGVFHGAMIKMRDFFFFAPYVHLWFLRALLVAVPLVFFCFLRKQSFKKIFGFFGCAYVVALLFTCYRPIYFAMIAQDSMLATFVSFYDSIFSMPPTGICVGALFVSIGAYIALEPRMISQRGSLIGLLLSLLLL